MASFLAAIPSRFKLVEINLNWLNSGDPTGFEVIRNSNYTLGLGGTHEEVKKDYSDNIKRNVNKARKAEVRVAVQNTGLDALIDMFRENRGQRITGLSADYYLILKNIVIAALKRRCCEIWKVYHQDELVAGAVFIKTGGRAIFLFSAISAPARDIGAMPLLIDSFIQDNVRAGVVLDFEGSNDANLARFYRGFGAVESVYLHIRRTSLPGYVKWLKKVRKW